MRELRTPGSVRGGLGDGHPYRDPLNDNYPGRWGRVVVVVDRCLYFCLRTPSFLPIGGQVTDPEGAVHRLVLWAGDLSTDAPL